MHARREELHVPAGRRRAQQVHSRVLRLHPKPGPAQKRVVCVPQKRSQIVHEVPRVA